MQNNKDLINFAELTLTDIIQNRDGSKTRVYRNKPVVELE